MSRQAEEKRRQAAADAPAEETSVADGASGFTPGEVADAAIRALAVRYQAGDGEALGTLYERLRPAIGAVLRRYRGPGLPGTITTYDVAQESWVVLAELASRWRPSGSFLAYFLRSFPGRMHRYVQRARPPRHTQSLDGATAAHDAPLSQTERTAGAVAAVEEAVLWSEDLASLPPNERAACILRVIEGRDFNAVARALKVSRASAHRIFRRALDRLAASTFSLEGETRAEGRPSDVVRLVRALHALAGPDGALPGRRRIMAAVGVGRRQAAALMAQLEAAGAVAERGPSRPGRLVEATRAGTLERLRAAACRGTIAECRQDATTDRAP